MEFEVAVFDFDGVLCDSAELALEVWNRLARIYRFRPIADPSRARELTTRELIARQKVRRWQIPLIHAHARLLVRREAADLDLFPEVGQILGELAAAGIPRWIVSSNSRRVIGSVVEREKLAVTGIESSAGVFSKAARLRKLRQRYPDVEGARMVYIGDQVVDIEAAQEAGLTAAAVSWGYCHPDTLRKAGPDLVLTKLGALLPLMVKRY